MADKKIQRSNMTQTDSKGNVTRAPKDNADGEAQNFKWWRDCMERNDSVLAQQIAGTIKFISTHQASRHEQLVVSTRLYGNSTAYGPIGASFNRVAATNSSPMSQRITYNLCQSVVDTLVSKIAKNKVVPMFLTEGGVWELQEQAKNLTKFTEGVFYQTKFHEKRVWAFRDACVWGTGILHVYADPDNKEVCVERVLPHELFVDLIESLTEEPRSLYRVRILDRSVVADIYPDKAEEIAKAMPANYQDIGGTATSADLITVSEAWHLPSGKDAGDGAYVVSTDDLVLYKEEYKKDYFPFVMLQYNKRLLGAFWGQGAVERLQNLQSEVNRLMILVQRSMWMGGSFKVLVENGSKVVSQHLNNDVGAIIQYSGTPPQYITPPMIQQDIYPYIDSLIAKGYQQEGVSQLSASSQKPMGLDSGKALRVYNDIEADRQLWIQQQIELFTIEATRQMIEVAKELKSVKISYPARTFMETIEWKDVKLKEEQYVMKAFPTSSLPEEPAGRFQTIQEYMQAGLITPRTGKRLLDMPDIEMEEQLSNAQEDVLHKIIENMLYKGEYRAPEPFYDLQLAQSLTLQYYNWAEYMNAPDEKLQLLRRFLSQVRDITGQNQPQQVTPPQAQPAAPPVSPLVPNVPGNNQGNQ
jgi:hypothetical protein